MVRKCDAFSLWRTHAVEKNAHGLTAWGSSSVWSCPTFLNATPAGICRTPRMRTNNRRPTSRHGGVPDLRPFDGKPEEFGAQRRYRLRFQGEFLTTWKRRLRSPAGRSEGRRRGLLSPPQQPLKWQGQTDISLLASPLLRRMLALMPSLK